MRSQSAVPLFRFLRGKKGESGCVTGTAHFILFCYKLPSRSLAKARKINTRIQMSQVKTVRAISCDLIIKAEKDDL